MADEYGPGTFFPEVFQNGVPDIQPALHDAARPGPRVRRDEDGHVTILRLDDVLEVTKRRDVHSMDPEMIELAGAFMGAGRPLIPLMLDGDAHTKYRKLLDPLFAPKVVAQLATAGARARRRAHRRVHRRRPGRALQLVLRAAAVDGVPHPARAARSTTSTSSSGSRTGSSGRPTTTTASPPTRR